MIKLVKATPSELDLVLKLEDNCFLDNYSILQIAEDLTNPNYDIYLAYNDGVLVGYVYIDNVLDTAEILRIGVVKEYRKRGFGTEILKKSYNLLNKNIKSIFLEVSSKNIGAFKMYKKLGFKQISVRKRYYKDGSDAIIMQLDR